MLSQEQSEEITRNQKLSLISSLEAALRAAKNSSDLSALDSEQLKSLLAHLSNTVPLTHQVVDSHEQEQAFIMFHAAQLRADLNEWSRRKKIYDEYASRNVAFFDSWLTEHQVELFERCNQILTQDRRVYETIFTDQNLDHEFFVQFFLFSNPEAFKKNMNNCSLDLLSRFIVILGKEANKDRNEIFAKKYVTLIAEMVFFNKTLTHSQRQTLLAEILFKLITPYWTSVDRGYRDELSVNLLEQLDDLSICNDTGKSLVQILTEDGNNHFPKCLNILFVRNTKLSNLDLESMLRSALNKYERCDKTLVESICRRLQSDPNWTNYLLTYGHKQFIAKQYEYIGECDCYAQYTSENMHTYVSALKKDFHELYYAVLQANLQSDPNGVKRVLGFLTIFSDCDALKPVKKDLCLSLFAYLAEHPLICFKLSSCSSELIALSQNKHTINAILDFSISIDHPKQCPLALAVKKKNVNYIVLVLQVFSSANHFELATNEYIAKQVKLLKRSGGDISPVISYLQEYTNSWNPLIRFSFEATLLTDLTTQQKSPLATELIFSSRDMKKLQQLEPELNEPLLLQNRTSL